MTMDLNTRRLGLAVLIVAMIVLELALARRAGAEPLTIQGSTTLNRQVMEPHQRSIEQVTGHDLTVIPSKTRPGLIALLEGRAHMAMISTPLEVEVDALKEALPGLPYERLQEHVIMTTRVAVAVHRSNPVRKLSFAQLRQVMRGEVATWAALGGDDRPLRLVLVGGGGGVTSTAQQALLDGDAVEGPHIIFVKTGLQVAQVLEQEPNAIGIGQWALLRQRGLPEVTTDRSIEQVLSMITLGDPSPAMRAVIDAARRAADQAM